MNKLMAPFNSSAQYAHCDLFPYRAIKNIVDIIQQFQQRTVRVVRVVADEKCHQFVHPLIGRMVVGLGYSPLFALFSIFFFSTYRQLYPDGSHIGNDFDLHRAFL